MLRKKWDVSKAQKQALDLAIAAILRQAGLDPCTKRAEEEPQVVFLKQIVAKVLLGLV